MATRNILRMGHPALMRRASPVTEFGTPALAELVRDLWDTMRESGGIGLAAPQIGEPWRVVVFGLDQTELGRSERLEVPRTVLVNPVIGAASDEVTEGWEACLSVPGMRGVVPRYEYISYRGRDVHGAPIDRLASGYHARVVQHECDHLDGILYPMRMHDLSTFGFDEELRLGELEPIGSDCAAD